MQVYSQGAGNLVAVRDSNFTRNRANEVGSGLMFGSFLYVQNRNESYIYTTSNWSVHGGGGSISRINTWQQERISNVCEGILGIW